jgi:hypothetical protein
MRRALAVLGFVSVAVSAASFTVLPTGATRAAGRPAQATFLIPPSDGYGTAECLTSGEECGRVVATAWCEAQGYVRATTFGAAAREETTASIAGPKAPRPIAITCAD